MLFGITGKKRSGKDTVGDYIKSQYDFESYAFADPVKATVKTMFGLTDDEMDNDNKESIISRWGFSYRQMLQILGTECGRNMFRKDIWLIRAQERIQNITKNLVITDCRFDNEAQLVKDNGGIIIGVSRDVEQYDTHSSEAGVSQELIDINVDNNGTISELYKQVDAIVRTVNDGII